MFFRIFGPHGSSWIFSLGTVRHLQEIFLLLPARAVLCLCRKRAAVSVFRSALRSLAVRLLISRHLRGTGLAICISLSSGAFTECWRSVPISLLVSRDVSHVTDTVGIVYSLGKYPSLLKEREDVFPCGSWCLLILVGCSRLRPASV